MSKKKIYTLHPHPLTVLYSTLENYVTISNQVLTGTPGSLLQRTNADQFSYYARQFYDALGKKRERYVAGPIGHKDADQKAEDLQTQIEELKGIIREIRLLGREGYQIVDPRTYSTLATLHNHSFFKAGGVLVGSHAFGVMLNHLGIRAGAYKTEDVDLAKSTLNFNPPPVLTFFEMLKESGIPFVEIPPFHHKDPITQWKEKGKSRFHVDLLVPSSTDSFSIVSIPELKVHAQGIPYLRYLLGETYLAPLLSRHGCCQVRIPTPERFAVHKLLVAQLRTGRTAKVDKDLQQASILIAVLGDSYSGALEDALLSLPLSVRHLVKKSVNQLQLTLELDSPQAWEELTEVVHEW